MRKDNNTGLKISRRSLLKSCLAGASLAAIRPFSRASAFSGASALKNPPLIPPDATVVNGYCPFCQVRCTYHARVSSGRIVSITGNPRNRWTGGAMCPKGLSILELMNSKERLTEPMLRTERGWKTVTYAEAVALVAEKLITLKKEHGPKAGERLALTSPLWDCRESELAALMTMRVSGGVNIMPAGEVCISTTSNVLSMLLGANTSTTTVDEITNARLLVLWGANLAETYPVYSRWLDKAKAGGTKIIYIDPRRTPTSLFADVQLQPEPGTDGVLALGTIRHILENGLYDAGMVGRTTTGLEALRKGASPWTAERVMEITRLGAEELGAFYADVAASERTVIWMGGSLCRFTNGVQTIRFIISLQGLTGNIIGSGRGLLTMEGGKPEGEKEFIDAVCGPASMPGVNFRRLLAAMKKGAIDLLFLNSSYRRYPDCDAVREAMKQCGFVVYRGFYRTDELEVADLFVPATYSPESSGSHYGAEKQVVWRDQAVEAPGSCVPDWRFYRDIGRLVAPEVYPDFRDPAELSELFNRTVDSWNGFSVEAMRKSPDGLVWPRPRTDSPIRTGSIFSHGVLETEDGKLNFALPTLGGFSWEYPRSSPHRPKAEKDFPLVLIQGKVVTQWQQTMTNFSPSLSRMARGRLVQVHPDTAAAFNLVHGDPVRLETVVGGLEARVDVTGNIRPGVVFTASHFVEGSPYAGTRSRALNSILPNNWDRVSAQFNGTGCRLVKVADSANIRVEREG